MALFGGGSGVGADGDGGGAAGGGDSAGDGSGETGGVGSIARKGGKGGKGGGGGWIDCGGDTARGGLEDAKVEGSVLSGLGWQVDGDFQRRGEV